MRARMPGPFPYHEIRSFGTNSSIRLAIGKLRVVQVNWVLGPSSLPSVILTSDELEYHFGQSFAFTKFDQIMLAGALMKIWLWTNASAFFGVISSGQWICPSASPRFLTGRAASSSA